MAFESFGQQFRFFVADEADLIQTHHRDYSLYETEELALISRYFRGGVFTDVGANVGNHAVFAAKVLQPSRVIAFEPDPLAAEICAINLALNDCTDAVELHRVGLSKSPSRAHIIRLKHNLGASRLVVARDGPACLARGDDVLVNETIGFIKIDTEGHELEVLEGLGATIERDRPSLFVEVENAHAAAFEQFCQMHRYRIAEHFRRYEACSNFLAVPEDPKAV